jgi:hypothetical protein
MAKQKIRTAEEAIWALEAYSEHVYEMAVGIADRYWDFIYERNPKLEWDQRSRLFLRCRKTGNSVQIEWYETRWVGAKKNGTRKAIRTYISKPKAGFSYSTAKLLALAQEWESDLVLETEARLAECRREAHAITRAIYALRPLLNKDPV